MPSDTMNEMIMGFVVILGVLVVYTFTLIIRIRKALAVLKNKQEK